MKILKTILTKSLIAQLLVLFLGFQCLSQSTEQKNEITSREQRNEVYRLILLAGQSNMVGGAQKSQITLPKISDNIVYYNYGKRMNLENVSDDTFGPELGIMEELTKHFPNEKFIILKYAIGGASMYGWSPDRDKEKVKAMGHPHFGKMSDSLFKYTALALKDKKVIPTAFVWMQGETDAKYELAGKEYASNFQKLIEAVRKEYHDQELAIIFGKVNPIASRYPGLLAVQSSQRSIAKDIANTYLVETDGLEKRSDSLHYSSKGLLGLGHRFGKIIVKVINENEQ